MKNVRKKDQKDENYKEYERSVSQRSITNAMWSKELLCAQLAISKQESYFPKVIESAENKQKFLFKVATDPVALALITLISTVLIRLINLVSLYHLQQTTNRRDLDLMVLYLNYLTQQLMKRSEKFSEVMGSKPLIRIRYQSKS